MFDFITVLDAIESNAAYLIILSFFAWYPLVTSGVLVLTSSLFFARREYGTKVHPVVDPDYNPQVSIIICAYNEESAHCANNRRRAWPFDYDDFEVIVVDDGSQ